MRSTFTMMRPSMMILSFSLRERMSMGSGYCIIDRGGGIDAQNARCAEMPCFFGAEAGNELLHEIERSSQQGLVLLRPLAHTHQQLLILLHQRVQQWLIVLWKHRDKLGKTRVGGLVQFLCDLALAHLSQLARVVDAGALRVDGGDGVDDIIPTRSGGLLLLFEQGEHFPILLQLV